MDRKQLNIVQQSGDIPTQVYMLVPCIVKLRHDVSAGLALGNFIGGTLRYLHWSEIPDCDAQGSSVALVDGRARVYLTFNTS